MNNPTQAIHITRVEVDTVVEKNDALAVEEPVEISISAFTASPPLLNKNISITMRTPGTDLDLALGFLFTEGIIADAKQVDGHETGENTINILLNDSMPLDLSKIERHFYTSSSCGVCGKASIDSIKTVCRLQDIESTFSVPKDLIKALPNELRKQQEVFESTGGLHAAALFDLNGKLMQLREDVGRHNALDKLIGWSFQNDNLPLNQHLLLLSGRASFELIQKAAMAGINFIMAVGAPSSLAVELAQDFDITLVGFLNENRYNVYHGVERIELG
ncbi:formate dehydrogenase accessory sulfurtransferase FdhD [Bacteroidia bacterium]|nr:formate dehydrogenase accessory sulfurtransferase FdhD [Bacteroidia bacterium]